MVSIIFAFAFFVGVCSGQPKSARILDGSPNTVQNYPFIVQFETFYTPDNPIGGEWKFSCGGNILASNIILSAAHCIEYHRQYHRIRAGATYFSRGGEIRYISKILIHPAYSYDKGVNGQPFNTVSDISLIRLKHHLKFGNTINYIPLISQGQEIKVDSIGTYAGWGKNENEEATDVLLSVNVRIMSHEECEQRYNGQIRHDLLCAGYDTNGVCHGDSGGPLIYGGLLVGIVKSGPDNPCGHRIKPDIAMKLSLYSNWIIKNSVLLQRGY